MFSPCGNFSEEGRRMRLDESVRRLIGNLNFHGIKGSVKLH